MSDQVFGDDFDDGDDMEYRRSTSAVSGKKIILLVALFLLLVLGVGAGVYFSGVFDKVMQASEQPAGASATQATSSETPADVPIGGPVEFVELPDMVVNLNAPGVRKSYLKLKLAIELNSIDQREYIETRIPRIMDGVQVYLRELTPDSLRGSAGLTKMRANLEARINAAVAPQTVGGVLFQEVLVQ